MNILSKYTWVTWHNQAINSIQRTLQRKAYKRRKSASSLSIKKIDNQNVISNSIEVRLFVIVRNESLRLPHFLHYYKTQGVDRFFLVDNNSTDYTVQLALDYPSTHVFQTADSYVNHWYWMEYLLEQYGKYHWCIVVDIDELFCFPHAETISIPQLCQFLDSTGSTAVRSFLLDLYSDQPVKETFYVSGQNPLDAIPFFETDRYEVSFPYFDRYQWKQFESTHYTGGMRERVFGKSKPITSLNKYPLFKFLPGTYLGQGMHAINGAKVSNLEGVVFHTKFLGDCIQEAQEESVREQHFNNAAYYKDFKQVFDANPDLCLATPNSIRFRDSAQLVELGLMKTNERFEEFARTQAPQLNEKPA
jgi:hypothetical protein